ncbi:MAG: hypothetical protein GX287_05360 [Fusobacteria bacterium]|nr:hypothetical protein [Fusobacteriota bacterium]
MEILKLYQEFLDTVENEYSYIKKGDLNDREITKFTDKKKIIMDMINKIDKNGLSNDIKNNLIVLINKIQFKEKEINNEYRMYIEKIQNDIKSIKTEEKLKKTYYGNVGTNFDKNYFDKKK